ncbi:MAG: hypothetical protein DRP35_02475 [Candidatus Zixiibacteriota bacterium]|nr:MAG: hypothetical protein DRP35_02475 [candidate division Zixibacteria bacterium]
MKRIILVTLILLLASWSGCKEKTPSRDYIPEIKNQLFKLQQAVKQKNRAAIDSLLSVEMLDEKLTSDSLLQFVYNIPERYDAFEFEQFGGANIIYSFDIAQIDCFIMDSTHLKDRPIVFKLILDDKVWLFREFKEGVIETSDSI